MNRTFRLLYVLLAASVLFTLRAEAQVADYGRENGIFSFENDTETATAGKGSRLSVSDEHNKLGHKSLLWEWSRPKAEISIKGDVPFLPKHPNPKEKSVASFVFWVYSPDTLEGDIRFSFLKEGRECCHFTYGLSPIRYPSDSTVTAYSFPASRPESATSASSNSFAGRSLPKYS